MRVATGLMRILCALAVLFHGVIGANSGHHDVEIHESLRPRRTPQRKMRDRLACCPPERRHIGPLLNGAVRNIFDLHKNLISWDTYKVLVGFFPLVLATRRVDKDIHRCFYSDSHHKNLSQVPGWCPDAMKFTIAAPLLFFGLRAFIGNETDEFRETTKMLLLGFPFVIWAKELIKTTDMDICRRPWNENFSCKERSLGGFPSGHVANAVYTASLYGLRFGPSYAIPLGLIAWSLGVTFVACNRHYLSQVVAGAGLGLLYGLAAQKTIDKNLCDCLDMGMSVDEKGNPGISATYKF